MLGLLRPRACTRACVRAFAARRHSCDGVLHGASCSSVGIAALASGGDRTSLADFDMGSQHLGLMGNKHASPSMLKRRADQLHKNGTQFSCGLLPLVQR
mmetsp:Transcript_23332/g.58024  ORF Transcript_23332/g.58024 Transcript_23332/m.58024 type:complete len:99 (+) Transcript_23332:2218-2514(+)